MRTNDSESDFLRDRQLLAEALAPVIRKELENPRVRAGRLTGSSYLRTIAGADRSSPPGEVLRLSASFTSTQGASHEIHVEISRSETGRPRVTLSADQEAPRMEYTVLEDVPEIIRILQSSIVGMFDCLCAPDGK